MIAEILRLVLILRKSFCNIAVDKVTKGGHIHFFDTDGDTGSHTLGVLLGYSMVLISACIYKALKGVL